MFGSLGPLLTRIVSAWFRVHGFKIAAQTDLSGPGLSYHRALFPSHIGKWVQRSFRRFLGEPLGFLAYGFFVPSRWPNVPRSCVLRCS